MSLGQSILAAAALIVLTILVISANRMIVQSQQDEYRAIAVNEASEIASAIMNEALSKAYDNYSYLNPIPEIVYPDTTVKSYPDAIKFSFTPPGSLGPESGKPTFSVSTPDIATATSTFQSASLYTDFDDYNGYVRKVDTPTMKGFLAKCTVTYVQANNLNIVKNWKGYFKRIVVTVEHPVYLEPPISFSAVKTY
jgi:hypothetical protein